MSNRKIDLNGIGGAKVTFRKYKIAECVSLPEPEAEQNFKPRTQFVEKGLLFTCHRDSRQQEPPVMQAVPVWKSKNLITKNRFNEFMSELETDFKIASYSVYFVSGDSEPRKICGDSINNLVMEHYLSLSNTVVLVNPDGISDDMDYRSRYVTRLYTGHGMYLICISSYAFEAFNEAELLSEKIYSLYSEIKLTTTRRLKRRGLVAAR